ncbi:MAG: hypothetical protein MUF18_00030 [Fimbriiglobus sp.]|jgi:hypothetical protein|nr:hypothetical protein [Fimbriiglobus sp.]
MNDSPRRQAITLTLTLLVFAYRELQRLRAVADTRDATAHAAGSVLKDEVREDARRVVELLEEWKDAMVGLGVGPLSADLNAVHPWPEASVWSAHRLRARPLQARVQSLVGKTRNVTAELSHLTTRIGNILHTLDLTDPTSLISEMVGT